jgi:hypothetical protein
MAHTSGNKVTRSNIDSAGRGRLAAILVVLLTILSTACDAKSGNPIPTKTSAGSQATPCSVTPSYAQSLAGPATAFPTPIGTSTTAKPYDTIHAQLLEFSNRVRQFNDCQECWNNLGNNDKAEAVLDEARQYWTQEVFSKTVTGWEGWIVNTGIEAVRGLRNMGWTVGYKVDEDPVGPMNALLVSVQDPFGASSVVTDSGRASPDLTSVYFLLGNAKETSGVSLCVGQKIRFEGAVSEVTPVQRGYDGLEAIIADTSVEVLNDIPPEQTLAPDLADVIIKFQRIPGFASGPDFKLTVFGNGLVIFEGSGVNRSRLSTISEDKVRQLLQAFDDAGFDSLPNYDKYEISDAPYTRTTLIRAGKTHSVLHYFGNSLDPKQLIQLEEKIDEIVQTDQWLGICGTDEEQFAPDYPCPQNK